MKRNLRLAFVFTLALFVFEPRQTPAQEVSEEQMTIVADNMHEQLARIGTIKAAVVAGRLADVRAPATRLADHETVAGLPADFAPYIVQLRNYARHVIEAKDLQAAGIAVSRMAKTCGSCHLVNGVELEFGFDQTPREDLEDVVTHMQRHQWAADRLWEGLIGPSDTAWNRGSDMLIDVPLNSEDVTLTEEHWEKIGGIARRIHALGGNGAEITTPESRSDLYGEVLGLCASCHVLLGRGPGY
jgi:cytochrome c553